MTNYTANRENGHESTDLEPRDIRALTEYLTVLDDVGRAAGADDLYLVVSQSGSEYLVDTRTESCTCPDFEYRDIRCKHLRRVAYATGDQPLPSWVDTDRVDDQLGDHITATPRVPVTDGGAEIIVAGDDAELLDADDDTDVQDDDRPEACNCCEWNSNTSGLPCWPCYREGFETPATEGDDV